MPLARLDSPICGTNGRFNYKIAEVRAERMPCMQRSNENLASSDMGNYDMACVFDVANRKLLSLAW